MTKYAEVVVNVPLQRSRPSPTRRGQVLNNVPEGLQQAYHYAIPASWAGRLQPGHLVQVPFGRQEVQGIVVALSETTPVPETRYLSFLLDALPVVSPQQIELARWMSQHYLTPLFPCLQTMLPPGMEQRSRLTVTWKAEGLPPEDLPPASKQLASLLQEKKELRSDQLNRRFDEKVWRKAVEILSARGLISMGAKLTQPRARVKVEQMAWPAVRDPLPALLRSSLGRTTKASRLLQHIWELGRRCPLDVVLREADSDLRTAGHLEGRGLLRIMLGSPTSQSTSSADPPNLDLPGPEGESQPAMVEPAVPLNILAHEVARMRRLEKHLAVLELLVGEEEGTWVGAICAETGANARILKNLSGAGLIRLREERKIRDPLAELEFVPDQALRLTPDQARVWKPVVELISQEPMAHRALLLHGVTGSGKTEIYLQALDRVLNAGRQAIVLVPEIALTPQTLRRFAARFPGRVTTIHSELSLGERYDQWQQIRAGEADVVIGPRSAVFAPLPRLGLIVVDEEHDDAYKSERMPSYHARDVAIERARLAGCPIILGSATPSMESYHRACLGEFQLLELPQRVMGHRRQVEVQGQRFGILHVARAVHDYGAGFEEACYIDLPAVDVVDLRAELRAGNRSIFSRALRDELKRVFEQGEQAILFLNRRGAATIVTCRDCGHVLHCDRCHVPMTYHGSKKVLLCHHCNFALVPPTTCPQCASRRIRYLGTGTERVEEALHELFPDARALRWDRDATTTKGSHQKILDQFIHRDADVLIGTQMIAKGLDLPLVTLVGVVLADTGLYLPDFRATERTFQLMAQVSGRAGRSILGGCVIIQTYTPDHYSIQLAARHDFAGFYQQELASRRELGYPPFCRLAVLRYSHRNESKVRSEAERMGAELRSYLHRNHKEAAIVGPAPCFFSRLRNLYRWQIVLRCTDPAKTMAEFPLPPRWRLDVDPASLL